MNSPPVDLYAIVRAGEDLVNAAGNGRVQGVLKALSQGADVNVQRTDQGALMGATMRRSLECVEVLLQHKADPNQRNRLGWTPLLEASAKDFHEIVQALLDAGANPSLADMGGVVPLVAAIRGKSAGSVKVLLDGGVDVNVADSSGMSPLMWAVSTENADIVGALLAAGADLAHVNAKGATALEIAQDMGWDLGVSLLKQAHRAQVSSGPSEEGPADIAPSPGLSKIGKRKLG